MGMRGFKRADTPTWSPFQYYGPPAPTPHLVCLYDWVHDEYVYVAGTGDEARRKGVEVSKLFGCRVTSESNRAKLFESLTEAASFAKRVNSHVAETRERNRPASPPAFIVGVPV